MANFDFGMQVLAKAMNLRLAKHSAIASNLANVDTPGYRPRAVSFEENLQKAVESRKTQRLESIAPKVEVVDDKIPRLDGNSVSQDRQLALLNENSTVYRTTAEFLKRKISMLKRAIG